MSDAPPFKLTRESRIRIDRDGRVWHEGERIENAKLARALASWIALDAATDRYILRNALDWCYVTVDDAPLVADTLRVADAGAAILQLSDGSEEPLDPTTLRIDADDVPYCDVRNGTLPCRLSRAAAFALLSHAEAAGDGHVLALGGARYPLRRVARGEGAPHRAPTRPDE